MLTNRLHWQIPWHVHEVSGAADSDSCTAHKFIHPPTYPPTHPPTHARTIHGAGEARRNVDGSYLNVLTTLDVEDGENEGAVEAGRAAPEPPSLRPAKSAAQALELLGTQ